MPMRVTHGYSCYEELVNEFMTALGRHGSGYPPLIQTSLMLQTSRPC